MVVVVLAGGDAPERAQLDAAWPGWDSGLELVIAADGGVRHAEALGMSIGLWVGDGDSTDPAELDELVGRGITVEQWPHDKDASDTDLAIDAALAAGGDQIILLGALGGARIDHALANVASIARAERLGRVAILDGRTRLVAIGPGSTGRPVMARLRGASGDMVSLLPLDARVDGITTDGLRYPLVDESLVLGSSRGISNVIERAGATVTVAAGRLLVIESPATL